MSDLQFLLMPLSTGNSITVHGSVSLGFFVFSSWSFIEL